MIVLGRGAVLSAANPLLSLFVLVGGALAAPLSAAWHVYDVSDDAKLLSPVSVASGTVDLTADAVTGVLPVGQYALAWTVPALEPLGKHLLVWTVATLDGTRTVREEFDVAVGVLAGGALRTYALPSDLRDEGVDASVSEARMQRSLLRATEVIERVCRRFFEPRALVLRFDGGATGALRVGDNPIIALAAAAYVDTDENVTDIELTAIRVYNRHATGLLSPDDRNDPRVTWLTADRPFPFRRSEPVYVSWRSGRQNVRLTGLFGYTDPDGSFVGKTPDRLREAAKMLAMRSLPGMWSDPDARQELAERGRVTSLTTRDQSVTVALDPRIANGATGGEFTGDPEVDAILVDYMAPPFVGSSGGASTFP